jgi:hypothetical protein
MQYGIWRAIDALAAQDFTSWVFALWHALPGLMGRNHRRHRYPGRPVRTGCSASERRQRRG